MSTIKAWFWNALFTPICHLYLYREWQWTGRLFEEVGARAWHAQEVKMGWWDKDGNPV